METKAEESCSVLPRIRQHCQLYNCCVRVRIVTQCPHTHYTRDTLHIHTRLIHSIDQLMTSIADVYKWTQDCAANSKVARYLWWRRVCVQRVESSPATNRFLIAPAKTDTQLLAFQVRIRTYSTKIVVAFFFLSFFSSCFVDENDSCNQLHTKRYNGYISMLCRCYRLSI